MTHPGRASVGLVLLGVICGGGCGSSLPSATGTVKLSGQPLTTGNLVFHPKGEGTLGTAVIASDGTFIARTGAEQGLVPGDYTVTVRATKPISNPDPEHPQPPAESLVAARYGDPKTSDLKFTIVEGDNLLPIELKP